MTSVRNADRSDVALLARMLRDSAIDQGGEQYLCVDPDNLLHDGFALQPPRFRCLVAECDGKPAGVALYFPVYSTWVSRTALYLEDLYVVPQFRHRGVARILMRELARTAHAEDCGFIRWLVFRNNTGAIRFYKSLRAESAGSDSMLIEGEALAALAAESAAIR